VGATRTAVGGGHVAPLSAAAERRARGRAGTRVFSVCLALFITVAVARIQDVVPGLAYLRPGKLLVLPIATAALVALPQWQLVVALRSGVARCVVLIGVLALLSIPLSIWPSNSVHYLLNALIPSLLLFVVASAGFADRRTARLCILALVLSVGLDAAFILVGFAPQIAGRPYIGVGFDPNESAALFVLALPFAITLGKRREKRRRLLGLAIALLLVAAVIATGSRGGVIGLLVVATTLILRAGSRWRPAYILAVVLCAAVIALAADDAQLARYETLLTPKSDYNLTEREGRVQVWSRGIGYMITHPVFGTGLNSFETAEGVLGRKANEGSGIRYTAAHNALVEIGAELGVIGLAAFVIAFWTAGAGCRTVHRRALLGWPADPLRAEQEATLAGSAYCALLGLAACGFFLSIAYHAITFFALAVCTGVVAGSPYSRLVPVRNARLGRAASLPRRAPAAAVASVPTR
jgi:O-antigen ligase